MRRTVIVVAQEATGDGRRNAIDAEVGGMMYGMALCAGVGGLELGLKIVLGDTYQCKRLWLSRFLPSE